MLQSVFWLALFKQLAAANLPQVYPVYSVNDSVDLVVSSMYKVKQLPILNERRNDVYQSQNRALNDDFREEVYLHTQKEACRRNSVTSCWTYNALSFVQNFLQPMPQGINSGRSSDWVGDLPRLVGLPVNGNNSLSILGRSSYWGFGDMYLFLEKQLSRFVQTHGIIFPAGSWDDALTQEFQNPVVLEEEEEDSTRDLQESRTSSQRKHKRKSVLFPLLILFKFFKIKMILVPILLTVLMVKKMLLAGFFLAPNILGMFRCRPPIPGLPPFGLASAGILQDVTDSRGEFSSLYNSYANPYRDHHGYRTRDFGRYESLNQQQASDNNDYST